MLFRGWGALMVPYTGDIGPTWQGAPPCVGLLGPAARWALPASARTGGPEGGELVADMGSSPTPDWGRAPGRGVGASGGHAATRDTRAI
eukprot:4796029-Alexandrium_andersonii.AAC.1